MMAPYLTSVLLALFSCAFAKCNRFVQQGDAFEYLASAQSQIVSNGIVCTKQNPSYDICGAGDPETGEQVAGCRVQARGMVHAHGFTNLSQIPEASLPRIYNLVSKSYRILNGVDPHHVNFNMLRPSLSGCLNAYGAYECASLGESGYLQYTPLLICVNGTFSECTPGWGEITNGTAVQLCGVNDEVTNQETKNSTSGPLPGGSLWPDFILTSPAVARTIRHPIFGPNATCNSYEEYSSSSSSSSNSSMAATASSFTLSTLWLMAGVTTLFISTDFAHLLQQFD